MQSKLKRNVGCFVIQRLLPALIFANGVSGMTTVLEPKLTMGPCAVDEELKDHEEFDKKM